ncbi:hypothetical protein EFA46_005315 [Halarchaeum sp. CBA1220]|uniref:hypothetical protein n=1 Tax=Halarchaeum sp. CBA1220 TaxID=1853682 RepID=UPI000F3AA818|nr:hypothetical protein [Halarchaeum sp. CBA1220]QLC33641.1 hypothetical protein EFA46_005315 [Halarchaeum sp. CBA1220]
MLLLLWKAVRPLLPYLLAFVALVAVATLVGDVTGWWDMHALLLDAAFEAARGVIQTITHAVEGAIQWVLDELAARLNPL